MVILNKVGLDLAMIEGVSALTDVTGFGLMGHLLEMCEGSRVSAVIDYTKVPVFGEVGEYLRANAIPGGTHRNWESYGHKLKLLDEEQRLILCDPQTSGGLLIAVNEKNTGQVEKILRDQNLHARAIGRIESQGAEIIKMIS